MPNVSSSLGSTQRYIPVVPSSQIGRFSGLFMHFPTLSALNSAVSDELLNVGEGNGLWADNQPMAISSEAALGVHRLWKTALSHARTVVIGPSKTAVLAGSSNVVISTTGAPAGGTGNDGDIAIDPSTSIYYTKATGAWTQTGTTGQLTIADKSKLDGIEPGATANSPDSVLKNRANHEGQQAASTISDFATSVDARISLAVGVSVRAQAATVSQVEAETGTGTSVRDWTPQRVAQAIAALAPAGGGGGGVTVQDEGTPLSTLASTLNFVGAGVTATGSGGTKTITIPGPGAATITVKEDNATVSTGISVLDFLGSDFDVSESPVGEANVSLSSAIARVATTQPLDATLTALAGTTTAANQGLYSTGIDAFSTYSLTAGGRSLGGVAGTANTFPYFSALNTAALGALTSAGLALLDDVDAAAQRTTLGLVIGTNVQAFDPTLQALSALGTTADRLAYTTGADTWAETPITAAARSVLDDTTTGAMLTTLGAQPVNANLTTISGLSPSNDDVLQRKAGAWTNRTLSQLQADLYTVPPSVVVESTTARTLSAADNGKIIRCTASSSVIITVPTAFSGYSCTVIRAGTGSVTFDPVGTTVNGSLVIDGQYKAAMLMPTGVANTFDLVGATGDLTDNVQDIVAGQFAAGTHSNISFSYNPTTGAISATVTGGGSGDVTTNTSTSVDGELVAFNGTTGKSLKRFTGSGLVKVASGVGSVAVAGTDYFAPGGTDIPLTDGGTGASDAAGARTNLGLVIGTHVQAYDAGLASIAGLTTLADRGIYTTASDTYAVYSLTAGGRALAGVAGTASTFPYFNALNTVSLASVTSAGLALLDDADAATQRTTLGLVIGTNVQAYDATLASLAALGTTADRLAYTTGVDTWAETPLTAAARTLLDDTSTAAMLTTLGAQPLDADLTAIAALTPSNDDIVQRKGGVWTNRTLAQVQTDLMALAPTVVVESTTARTLSAGDNGKIIRCTNAGATVITVPTAFSGYSCTIVRAGAGSVTLATSGTTVNGSLTVDALYRSIALLPTGTANTFDAISSVANASTVVATVTNTSYSLSAADNNKILRFTNTGAITITVPTAFNGSYVTITWLDAAGTITLTPSSTTLNGSGSSIVLSQSRGTVTLIPTDSANAWDVQGSIGDLTPASIGAATAASPVFTGPETHGGVGIFTSGSAVTITSNAGVVDVTKPFQKASHNANCTLTFSATPATDTIFTFEIINTDAAAPHTWTIPSAYSESAQATVTTVVLPASGRATLVYRRDASSYQVYGDPQGAWDTAEETLASAATTTLANAASRNVSITGTTGITSFGNAPAGTYRRGRFTGSLTLTYSSSLVLEGGKSITVNAGDRFEAWASAANTWVVNVTQMAESRLQIGTTISSSRALTAADFDDRRPILYPVNTSSASVALNLPSSVGLPGQRVFFQRRGTNALTIVSGTGGTVVNPDSITVADGAIVGLVMDPITADKGVLV